MVKRVFDAIVDTIDWFLSVALVEFFCWVYEFAFVTLALYVFLGVVLAPFI